MSDVRCDHKDERGTLLKRWEPRTSGGPHDMVCRRCDDPSRRGLVPICVEHCDHWWDCEPCCRCGFDGGGENCDCEKHTALRGGPTEEQSNG